jgi:hypothetical protein
MHKKIRWAMPISHFIVVLIRGCSQKTLNIHVILNGAQQNEESRRPKKRDSCFAALRMTNNSLLIALWYQAGLGGKKTFPSRSLGTRFKKRIGSFTTRAAVGPGGLSVPRPPAIKSQAPAPDYTPCCPTDSFADGYQPLPLITPRLTGYPK